MEIPKGIPSIVALVVIGGMVLIFGGMLILRLNREHPLSPYALQIFGLIIILPVLMALILMGQVPKEATTGFLGAIIGFFFGAGRAGRSRQQEEGIPKPRQPKPIVTDDD